jgi:hypothetical protein
LGVGPPPIPLDRLDAAALAAGLRDLAAGARPGGRYRAAARAAAGALSGGGGAARAAASVLRGAGSEGRG